MTKRIALIALLAFSLSGAAALADQAAPAAAEKTLSVFTYQFKHRQAEKAAAAIKALVSAEGTVAIQPSSNSLVITDRTENLKDIAAALHRFDAAPQPVQLSVRLVTAARVAEGGRVPDALKDVAPKLAMLRYNSFDSLGAVNISGREGEPGIIELGERYRANFRFGEYDSASDSIPLVDFKLSRLQDDQLRELYKTTLNLKLGQTLIFGATRDPESQRALVVIVSAKR
ncbi:MAG TPA: secretin N-terminal domain-containing protein [Thermoanaerobaculia bacterium]|nr:secretin N-terminal domain-containing protein [Thermoanaerobaculia bacterium]